MQEEELDRKIEEKLDEFMRPPKKVEGFVDFMFTAFVAGVFIISAIRTEKMATALMNSEQIMLFKYSFITFISGAVSLRLVSDFLQDYIFD